MAPKPVADVSLPSRNIQHDTTHSTLQYTTSPEEGNKESAEKKQWRKKREEKKVNKWEKGAEERNAQKK